MIVKELIEKLKDLPEDARVAYSVSHNRWDEACDSSVGHVNLVEKAFWRKWESTHGYEMYSICNYEREYDDPEDGTSPELFKAVVLS